MFREAKKVPALKIRDDIRENYNRTYNELQKLYGREKFNDYVGMSLFWLTCVEEVYNLLVEERIMETKEEKVILDYNKAAKCLTNIAEVMIEGLWHPGYAKLRVSVHKTSDDIFIVKEMNKKEMREVLNLANDQEEIVDEKLENAKAYLENEEKVTVRDEIRKIFIRPLIKMIEDAKDKNKEDKLIIGMVSAAFIRYIKEYEVYY